MCNCVPSTLNPYPGVITSAQKPAFTKYNLKPRTVPVSEIVKLHCSHFTNLRNSYSSSSRNGELQFRSIGAEMKNTVEKWKTSLKASRNSRPLGSEEYELELKEEEIQFETSQSGAEQGGMNTVVKSKSSLRASPISSSVGSDEYELELKEEDKQAIQFGSGQNGKEQPQNSSNRNGIDNGNSTKRNNRSNNESVPSGVDFLQFNGNIGAKAEESLKDEDLIRIRVSDKGVDLKLEELECNNTGPVLRSRRQMMRRSNMIAKQVISIHSALSLGFVSQLWVDTTSVGDVVLIGDESVMEKEFKLGGLDTLVGYNVVTRGRRNIGKVRGYTFNIDSGAVESLELDSFGISIIPSSLVSTYALFVEDVLEVVFDTVVVHEAAASRVQKLTKGLWGAQNMGNSIDEFSKFERRPVESDHRRNRQRNIRRRNIRSETKETTDGWELPMDYL